MTAVSYAEETPDSGAALGFGTSHGYLNVITNLADDLTRSTNRVETFQIKSKEEILAVRALTVATQDANQN